MSVKLRLRRVGKKKQPMYRVVVADSRASRDGRFIENVGTYNPLTDPYQVEFKEDRILYWLGNGAQPSRTVKNLFQKKGLWLKWDLMRQGADENKISEELAKWEVMQAERVERLAANAEKKAKAKAEEKKKVAEEEVVPVTAPLQEEVVEQAAPVEAEAKTEAPSEEPAAEEKPEAKATAKEEVVEEPVAEEEASAETETTEEVPAAEEKLETEAAEEEKIETATEDQEKSKNE